MKSARTWRLALAGLGLLQLSAALAAPAQSPLFLANTAVPNVFFEVDDSGSMDWTILTKRHWRNYAYDPDVVGTDSSQDYNPGVTSDGNFYAAYSASGYVPPFVYVYSSADDAYLSWYPGVCGSTTSLCETSARWIQDWRVRAAALNTVYYDPAVQYVPWPGFSDASFIQARNNPQPGEAGYTQTRDLTGMAYEVAVDDSGFSGNRPRRGINTNRTLGPNGWVDLWDSHTRYAFTASGVTRTHYSYTAIDSVLPGLALNPVQTVSTLSGAICHTALGGGSVSCRTIDQARQNFANWYQYYRRRALLTKGAIGRVITDSPNNRYGLSLINSPGTLFVQMPAQAAAPFTQHNAALLSQLYGFNWQPLGTPLRVGLKSAGDYYQGALAGKPSPIQSSCQQNFTVLFTDGYWNDWSVPGIGNVDADPYTATLADVARHYYTTDLSALPNQVPPNAFDPVTHQHMVTFGVAFGVAGNRTDTDGDGWPNPLQAENSDWGDPFASEPAKIDDLWHAAYNSRGTFAQAQSADAVTRALGDALASVASRVGAASALAANTGRLGTDSAVYQARFDSTDWSGRLLAYAIRATSEDANANGVLDVGEDANGNGVIDGIGALGAELWDAAASGNIPAAAGRNLRTSNPTAPAAPRGLAFQWASLTPEQRTALDTNPVVGGQVTPANVGVKTLEYLRGDAAQESPSGPFRRRTSRLGDLINSDPVYVGAEDYAHDRGGGLSETEKSSYAAFRSTKAARRKMLYIGGNDGIMHGFDAASGQERFGFVPDAVIPQLKNLTSPSYVHQYFVDGAPSAADAFVDGVWKSVLLGGTGAGGRAVFALDVSQPDAFGDAQVLWEISPTASPSAADRSTDTPQLRGFANNLGYTLPQAAVARMADGHWVALVANGYDSPSGRAILYVVDLASGTLLRAIDTQTGPGNGLSAPAAVDLDGDQVADVAYAGDLLGNLWKFDFRSANPAAWGVAYAANGAPEPLFVACTSASAPCPAAARQAITARPEVGRALDATQNGQGQMVYFGTGRYFATEDLTSVGVQSFYGIWDRCGATAQPCDGRVAHRGWLTSQAILDEQALLSRNLRVTSQCPVVYGAGPAGGVPPGCSAAVERLGWLLDLSPPAQCNRPGGCANVGERVVGPALLGAGRVLFATLVPSSSPCVAGGTSWLMEMDTAGRRLARSPWDINGDRRVDASDLVQSAGVYLAATGLQSGVGIVKAPTRVVAGGEEFLYLSGSQGSMAMSQGQGGAGRRVAWRQLQ